MIAHQFATARRGTEAVEREAVQEMERAMERVKNTGLVFCLFVVLLVVFSSFSRANELGTFSGALAGTPILIHVFNRLVPSKRKVEQERTVTSELVARI